EDALVQHIPLSLGIFDVDLIALNDLFKMRTRRCVCSTTLRDIKDHSFLIGQCLIASACQTERDPTCDGGTRRCGSPSCRCTCCCVKGLPRTIGFQIDMRRFELAH